MSTKIYFDMDGTIYDLYSIPNWLELLRGEQPTAFTTGERLFTDEFYKVVSTLMSRGVQFGVITWTPMQASPEYEEICRAEKIAWCKEHLPFITSFVAQSYGTPKQQAIKSRTKNDILIDDNSDICKMWENGKTRRAYQVTAQKNVTQILYEILYTLNKMERGE